jgi:hypothetical protein
MRGLMLEWKQNEALAGLCIFEAYAAGISGLLVGDHAAHASRHELVVGEVVSPLVV